MKCRTAIRSAWALFATLLLSVSANAQLFRAYLAPSPAGNDANPCTLPAPCRLLPAALAAVADGGDIWILDSANYNTATVTVDKSVTILAVPGVVGSLVGNGGPALEINGAGISVRIQNLRVRYLGGTNVKGVVVTNAASVALDNCDVTGFTTGLEINAASSFTISGSTFFLNTIGIAITGAAKGTISRTKLASPSGAYGIYVNPATATNAVRLNISETETSGHSMAYFTQTGSNVIATITRSVFANCGQCIQQQGTAGSIISVSSSVVTGATWPYVNAGPQSAFETYQDNVLSGNANGPSGPFTNRAYQ